MKKNGNISILVIFVLIASSLIGVLTMNFINQILYSSDNFLSYYKSYYMANAGLELLLVEAKNRGIGFENNVSSGNVIVSQNFGCTNCDFAASVQGTANPLSSEFWKGSGCISPIILKTGNSVLIPFTKDNFSGSFADALNGKDLDKRENLSNNIASLKFEATGGELKNQQVNIGMLILSGSELFSDGMFFRTGLISEKFIQDFLNQFAINMNNVLVPARPLPEAYIDAQENYPFKNYLIIANTAEDNPISFCIDSPTPLPTDNFYIKSNGRYHQQNVGLELIFKQPIPSFLLNSSFGF